MTAAIAIGVRTIPAAAATAKPVPRINSTAIASFAPTDAVRPSAGRRCSANGAQLPSFSVADDAKTPANNMQTIGTVATRPALCRYRIDSLSQASKLRTVSNSPCTRFPNDLR